LDTILSFSGWSWAAQMLAVLLAALVADLLQRRLLSRLERRLAQLTRHTWDEAVVGAARGPLSLLIWLLGLSLAAEIALRAVESPLLALIAPARALGAVAAFTWFFLGLERRLERELIARASAGQMRLDAPTVETLGKLLRLSLLAVAALIAAQTLGFSIAGLLAFGGLGGIVAGFAAKDLLANLFGGLMIYLDRPFAVGDWIRSPDKDIEGIVEDISWRRTRIRTFDQRPLYVPNAVFSTIAVENASRMSHRRIREIVGLRYQDAAKVADIVRDIKAMLAAHPRLDPALPPMVALERFGASTLDLVFQAFSRVTDYAAFQDVKQDVLLQVAEIVHRHGADIAFPTSTVHVPDGLMLKEEGAGHMKFPVEIVEEEEEPVPSWKREEGE
jgi:MscS family membrane protein